MQCRGILTPFSMQVNTRRLEGNIFDSAGRCSGKGRGSNGEAGGIDTPRHDRLGQGNEKMSIRYKWIGNLL